MADTPAQPDFMKQLAAALAAVAGGVGGRALANQGGNPLQQAVPPQLTQMLDQANQRQAYQNPLFQATTQGVYDMLPDFAKTGTALSGTLSNSVPAAPPPSGSGGPGLGTAAGIGGLGALAALAGLPSGSSFDLGKIFDAIKKKFSGQMPGVQGNQPNAGGGLPSGNPGMNGFTGWPSGDAGSGDPLSFLPSDPGVYWGESGGGSQPTDPSGGTGIGPGMQNYYNGLGGGGENHGGGAGNWWDE